MLTALAQHAKTAAGLAKWARAAITPDPRAWVLDGLRNRENSFLQLVRRGIFENPSSPYAKLFAWAGCEFGDLERAVRSDGLEAGLRQLYRSGIYLTHGEFKGRDTVRRGSHSLELSNNDLANPAVRGILEISSSGSRGRGTVTRRSLEYQLYREAQEWFLHEPYELDRRAIVLIASSLPASGGIRRLISHRRWNLPVTRWFDQPGELPYRILTRLIAVELALLGKPVAFPGYLPFNDFTPVARYLAREKQRGRLAIVEGGVSRAVRVADAALRSGSDISGTLMLTTGEALTPAKRELIESTGCEVHARYTISELGPVGIGCRAMRGNCVHLCMDSVAVIGRPRIAPLSDTEVNSFLFTSLRPEAPTILLNVEMDDAGDLAPTSCGCEWERLGFNQQADKIFSYGKLTGHGTTLVGSDLLHILETVLPAAFGGVSVDYQLVEFEAANQTEYELRVDPRVGIPSTRVVRDRFLAEVKRLWGGSLTVSRWVHGEGVRVVEAVPYSGRHGKVLSLHLLGKQGGRAGASR